MSRRHAAEKREILPDAKFGDRVLSKFMNNLMVDGKKSIAEKIVYNALDRVEGKLKRAPVEVFHEALDNIKPTVEVRSRRVGGAPPTRLDLTSTVGLILSKASWNTSTGARFSFPSTRSRALYTIFSAMDFLPSTMRLFMNLLSTRSPNFAKFGDRVLSKFMNNLMVDGKKSIAEKIVYNALDRVEGKLKRAPVEVFHEALDNIKPTVEVRSRRVGGAPPTRLDLTSTVGLILSKASWNTSTGARFSFPSTRSRALYTIFSAMDFLPSTMRLFMNLLSTRSPNFASGRISRFSAA